MTPLLEPAGIAGRVAEFVDRWTRPLFPSTEQEIAVDVFSRLVRRAFSSESPVRSQLCSDGTPIEFSLAIDNLSRFAVRYVCDTTNAAMPVTELNAFFRSTADIIVPGEWPSATALDRLFERHLAGAPDYVRFRVWHGAGFAPGGHRLGKLYFNTQWFECNEVLEIISEFLAETDRKAVPMPAALSRLGCDRFAGVGYDFDAQGLAKLKLYLRPREFNQAAAIEEVVRFLAGNAAESFARLTSHITADRRPNSPDNCVLSLGFLPRSEGREAKAYFQWDKWGTPTFTSVGPVLNRILTCWGVPAGTALMASGPNGFSPTLIAVGADSVREMISVYFKPLLPPAFMGM